MLKNSGSLVIKGTSELKKSKSFEDFKVTKDRVARNSYHGTGSLEAKSTPKGDDITISRITRFDDNKFDRLINLTTNSRKKGEEIASTIQEAEYESKVALGLKAKKFYDVSYKTFKKALEHDCFYDLINQNNETVTITFLPITTSENKVLCGLQKFDTIHLMTNGLKEFYITRILFHKTMTKTDFIKGESKNKYQDKKFRRILFDEVQKDLEVNSYSLLKDTDIENPSVEFFTKELPLVKFKFTDLEF